MGSRHIAEITFPIDDLPAGRQVHDSPLAVDADICAVFKNKLTLTAVKGGE